MPSCTVFIPVIALQLEQVLLAPARVVGIPVWSWMTVKESTQQPSRCAAQ